MIMKILILFLVFLVSFCRKPFKAEGVVLFSKGDVKLSEKPVQTGMPFTSSNTLTLGADSLADVQFSYPGDNPSSVVIRLEDNSHFSFRETDPKKNQNLTFFLESGSATFKINQLKEKLEFTIETPLAGVLSNKGEFQVSISPNQDVTIQVLMGQVRAFPKIPDSYLKEIPENVRSEVKDIQDIQDIWKKEPETIETGQKLEIIAAEIDEKLEKAGLKRVIDKYKQVASQQEIQKNPEKLQEVKKEMEQEFASNVQVREYIKTIVKEELPFKVETLSVTELKAKLKEVESLTYIDPQKIKEEKNLKELIEQRNKEIKPSLMKKVAIVTSGNVADITTKDGRNLECVVYSDRENPDYYFCDPVVGGDKERLYKLNVASLRFKD